MVDEMVGMPASYDEGEIAFFVFVHAWVGRSSGRCWLGLNLGDGFGLSVMPGEKTVCSPDKVL